MIDFKGHRFEKNIILLRMRWHLAYPLSYRKLEEMMEEKYGGRSYECLSLGSEIYAAIGG